MTNYQKAKVKIANTQLKKIKSCGKKIMQEQHQE